MATTFFGTNSTGLAGLCVVFCLLMAPSNSNGQDSLPTGIVAAGKQLYEGRCSNCHSNEPSKTIFAPTLHGLMGRKAGSVEGFPYTPKILNLGFDWSPETLSTWLETSTLNHPILRMRHLGVEEPFERDALIAYISTLK